jgi:hypothetical protein
VVAAPLAVVVGLNEPHGAVAQVTDQVTPVPLLTVAVMDAVAPGARDAGCPLRETVTAGGGGVEPPPPPQAVRPRVNAAIAERERTWRRFIAHLRIRFGDARLREDPGLWMGGSEIRAYCEGRWSDCR